MLPVLLVSALRLGSAASPVSVPLFEIAPGVQIPAITIGTWISDRTEKASWIVGNWTALGGRGIDTAFIYLDQEEVAAAVSAAGLQRSEIYYTSKIPACGGERSAGVTIEADLKALATDYIDLMLIHSAEGPDCLGTWKALEKHHAEGKLKAIGVSNWKSADFEQIISSVTVPISVNQILYNVLHHDETTIGYCRAHNITVQAYSPLGGTHGTKSVFGDPTVASVAAAHNVSAAQVALRWIIQRGDILTVQSQNADHQSNDADIFDFALSDDEMGALSALSVVATR